TGGARTLVWLSEQCPLPCPPHDEVLIRYDQCSNLWVESRLTVLGETRGLPRPSQPNWLVINFDSLSHSRQRRSTTSFTEGTSRNSPQLMPAGRHIASGSPVMSARGETNW